MPSTETPRQTLQRIPLSQQILTLVSSLYNEHLAKCIAKHSNGAYVSRHEILGTVTEEYHELIEAVRSGQIDGAKNSVCSELLDMAVACLFGVACIKADVLLGDTTPIHIQESVREYLTNSPDEWQGR